MGSFLRWNSHTRRNKQTWRGRTTNCKAAGWWEICRWNNRIKETRHYLVSTLFKYDSSTFCWPDNIAAEEGQHHLSLDWVSSNNKLFHCALLSATKLSREHEVWPSCQTGSLAPFMDCLHYRLNKLIKSQFVSPAVGSCCPAVKR